MVSKILQKFQNKLSSRVFNSELGTDVTITTRSVTATTDGGWSTGGDFTNDSTTTVKGIPITNQTQQLQYQAYGFNNTGDATCYLPYDTAVDTNDLLTWADEDGNDKDYFVKEVEPFPVGNGIAAIQVRCAEHND